MSSRFREERKVEKDRITMDLAVGDKKHPLSADQTLSYKGGGATISISLKIVTKHISFDQAEADAAIGQIQELVAAAYEKARQDLEDTLNQIRKDKHPGQVEMFTDGEKAPSKKGSVSKKGKAKVVTETA